MFKLMRFYSISSLVGFIVTAVLLMVFVRRLVIGDIVQLAERSTVTLANSMLNPVGPDLVEYLARVQDLAPPRLNEQNLPPRLSAAVADMMRDGAVVRVKIYNRQGMVVFSTKSSQIGDTQHDNAGFATAIGGSVLSTLIYRDTFNRLDRETEEDNLMQTYIPVRGDPTKPIPGVFEIYMDITPLVYLNERTQFNLLALVGSLLAVLYGALILLIRRANRIIDTQQETIRDRTENLERLSAQMLTHGEIEKKRLALDLHEGLAQTLSATKAFVESSREKAGSIGAVAESLERIVPVLTDAINEVQAIATELRPSTLDGLGLLPTLDWFCREFEEQHPDKLIEKRVLLQESNVPGPLKIVLYRIVESTLKNLVSQAAADRIQIDLRMEWISVVLVIEASPLDSSYSATTTQAPGFDLKAQFVEARERTTLSGGTFSIDRNAAGGVRLQCMWSTDKRVEALARASSN